MHEVVGIFGRRRGAFLLCVFALPIAAHCGNGNAEPAGSGGTTGGTGGASAGTSGGTTSTGGGGAGAATGGTGGTGPASCPAASSSRDEVLGWAAVDGDGVPTTTGGEGGMTIDVADAATLKARAAGTERLVLRITQSMDVGTLDVGSNKTLLGAGPDIVLSGSIRVRPVRSQDPLVSNVVLKNLKVNGATALPNDGGDAIHIERAHHVWIDHCEVYDAYDGNCDVSHGANWVTISWSKFHYTAQAANPAHQFSNLIGHSDDNAAGDSGRLKVTFHHNWWGQGIEQRMPRTRFGQIHVFNNYYRPVTIVTNSAAIAAGLDSSLLIENNFFDGVKDPHFHHEASNATMLAVGNVYTSTTTGRKETDLAAFTPPYAHSLDSAECIPDLVTRGAGPR